MILEKDVAKELIRIGSLEREVQELKNINKGLQEALAKAIGERDQIMIEHLCLCRARCNGCPSGNDKV